MAFNGMPLAVLTAPSPSAYTEHPRAGMQLKTYEDVVRRLDRFNYDVRVETDGYLIQHRNDPTDVRHAATLGVLFALPDLMEWAAQCKQSQQRIAADTTAQPQKQ
jgi:hypothetical protein